jgi:hypothetical protein
MQFRWVGWNRAMSRKNPAKPYWEMTTEELREATRECEEEFVADKAKPLTPQMCARWERARARPPRGEDGPDQQREAGRPR